MSLQLLEKLQLHASKRPDAIAIRQIVPDNSRAHTWRHLHEMVDAVAALLERTLPGGSVVMLCSSNRAEFTAAFLGILAAGMHVFPVATDIAPPELMSAGQRAGAGALLVIGQPVVTREDMFSQSIAVPELAADAIFHDLPAWPPRLFDAAGLLLLSSGTTGRPKIVRRDGKSLDAVSANMVESIGFTPDDRVLAAVPLCHSYGMEHGLLCPVWSGCLAHLYDRFDLPAAVNELNSRAITIFPGVPFMFETLAGGACAKPDAPTALRRAYSAGGPLPRSLFDAFAEKFGVPIAQLYGATEIGSVTFNNPQLSPFNPASVGRPMNDVSIQILDPADSDKSHPLAIGSEGHVAVRAPSMLAEYFDGEPPALDAGHFLTGDLGRLDDSGALTITGRIKLLIDVAGRKVNPLEVEEVLASHPMVGDCVVVAIRVSETLNRLRAVITPARPDELPTNADLRQFARSRLSAYKVPRVFEIRDTLPRSPAGKILRNIVEESAGETPSA